MIRFVTPPLAAVLLSLAALPAAAQTPVSLYDFRLPALDGGTLDLADFRGRVMLLVNTASKCGYTYQYEGLENLYAEYGDSGLTVLGFPSNDFLNQEPGTAEEIQAFCTLTFGVRFPMSDKISVRGRDIHPLYAWLTSEDTNPGFAGRITWNFNKFLVGRDGRVLARWDSKTEPGDPEVVRAVEAALAAPAG